MQANLRRMLALWLLMLVIVLRCMAAGAEESLRIGKGDVVSVRVFRESNLDTKLRVLDSGTIALPLIGQIEIAGLSTSEAAQAIALRYSVDGYLNKPQVSVLIEESAAQQIAVLGEVGRPGTVLLSSGRSLLDVLAEAGGLLKTADRHVTIRRHDGSHVTVLVSNESESNIALGEAMVGPGDTVLVPRAGIVYVLGDVGRPGGYLMQDDSRLTLMQALALAAGTTRTAASHGAHILRKVHGHTEEIAFPLKAIEEGKQPDIALQNDDIVYVPFSFARNLALGAPSIAASASSAIIYAAY
jgi:polysaccharide export outer membrane protein